MGYKVVGQGQGWTVIQADIIDYLEESIWLRQYEDTYFHFCFSDWPYHLDSIASRFSGSNSTPAKFGKDGSFQRQSRGFMNWSGDSTDLAYQPATWTTLLPHLYPGAFTASFTHPRKQHRLAMAQEVAGYVMNPALYQLGWCYSSGKPSGTRVDLQIDKRALVEREVIGISPNTRFIANQMYGGGNGLRGHKSYQGDLITAPATPLAKTWAGHQYGSPLAPELEPIIIAQKPWGKDRLGDITRTGAGAINIDKGKEGMPGRGHPGHLVITHHPGCVYRGEKVIKAITGTSDGVTGPNVFKQGFNGYGERRDASKGDADGMLSVPAYDCHPDCPAYQLDQQTGEEKSYHFYQADWTYEIEERLAGINPVFYTGKVGGVERNGGLDSLPRQVRNRVNPGGLEHEPRFVPTMQHNNHPTLKPLKLCKWIAGLFLPPIEYTPRRVLIPTAGTGSEAIGCLLASWDEVIAIELDMKFAEIACNRLEWWSKHLEWGLKDVDKILESAKGGAAQSSFF